jgi:hypothetical protein
LIGTRAVNHLILNLLGVRRVLEPAATGPGRRPDRRGGPRRPARAAGRDARHGIGRGDGPARRGEEHERIFAALATHEPELARAWATVHVAGVEHWLRVAAGASGDGREDA